MYHIFKQTRVYEGEPYCGYTSFNHESGKKEKLEFADLEEAKRFIQEYLNIVNPVGWNIWDAETGKLVEGNDFFAE